MSALAVTGIALFAYGLGWVFGSINANVASLLRDHVPDAGKKVEPAVGREHAP